MKNRVHDMLLMFVKTLNIGLITAAFAGCFLWYYMGKITDPYYVRGRFLVIVFYLVLYVICCNVYDALYVSLYRISEMIRGQILSVILADFVLYFVIWLLMKRIPNVWPLLVVLAVQVSVSVVWSLLAHRWYFRRFAPKRSLIVYDSRQGLEQLVEEYGLDIKFNITGTVSIAAYMETMQEITGDNEVIFLCGIHSHERNIIIKYCVAHNITAYVIPRIGDVIMSGAKNIHLFHLPIMQLKRYHPSLDYVAAKRVLDVLIAAAGLIVFSPVMGLIALVVKLTSPGPVLYKQTRLTKNGRQFQILKFRSMYVDAEKDGMARLSTGEADVRVTPAGRKIRKIRLDELPQLINVLRGDMSIVGPRPERPEIAEEYAKELPEFQLRLQAKAGLTGYAQVYGKYNSTPYDKLQMDLMYIAHPSIFEDLRIIMATIKILMMPESTQGVMPESEAAATKEEAGEKNDAKKGER